MITFQEGWLYDYISRSTGDHKNGCRNQEPVNARSIVISGR